MISSDRLHLARETNDSNCIGTAFFLAGINPVDGYISTKSAGSYLERMVQLPTAQPGAIVAFRSTSNPGWISHLAVIVGTNPLQVTHRSQRAAPLEENRLLEYVSAWYAEDHTREFYDPTTYV